MRALCLRNLLWVKIISFILLAINSNAGILEEICLYNCTTKVENMHLTCSCSSHLSRRDDSIDLQLISLMVFSSLFLCLSLSLVKELARLSKFQQILFSVRIQMSDKSEDKLIQSLLNKLQLMSMP